MPDLNIKCPECGEVIKQPVDGFPNIYHCGCHGRLYLDIDLVNLLAAELAKYKEALNVFAEEGGRIDEALGHLPDDFQYSLGRLNFGHLRRAAEVCGDDDEHN